MEEMKKYFLGDVCSRLSSGKGISSEEVFENGPFPVIGGNGLRGYALKSNFSGECGIIGRQGAYCGNVRFFSGEAYMTEHAVVVVGNENADTRYLTYLLSTMHLGNLSAQSAQPGLSIKTLAKQEIMLPSLAEQKRRASILASLEDKIDLNNRINHNLEEQIQERFDSMIISDNGLGYCQIADYVDVNPKRSLRKNEPARCVDMSYLSTTGPFPSGWETKGYNGGMKFFNGDTIMARITPCLENGKVAYVNFLDDGEIAFGSTEFIVLHAKEGVTPVFTYFLARNKNFVDYATKNMNGSSGRQRVSGDTIGKYMIPVIDSDSLNEFSGFATPAMDVIRNNSFESRSLAATRDALLPLLLSGELSISQMNC
jgi:type I restriction enzyme S subunit